MLKVLSHFQLELRQQLQEAGIKVIADDALYPEQAFGSVDRYNLIDPKTYANPEIAATACEQEKADQFGRTFRLLKTTPPNQHFDYSVQALKASWNMAVLAKQLLTPSKILSAKSNVTQLGKLIPFLSNEAVPQVVDETTKKLAQTIQQCLSEMRKQLDVKENASFIIKLLSFIGFDMPTIIKTLDGLHATAQGRLDEYQTRVAEIRDNDRRQLIRRLIKTKHTLRDEITAICPTQAVLKPFSDLQNIWLSFDSPQSVATKPIQMQLAEFNEAITTTVPQSLARLRSLVEQKDSIQKQLDSFEHKLTTDSSFPDEIFYYTASSEEEYFLNQGKKEQLYHKEKLRVTVKESLSVARNEINGIEDTLVNRQVVTRSLFDPDNYGPRLQQKERALALEITLSEQRLAAFADIMALPTTVVSHNLISEAQELEEVKNEIAAIEQTEHQLHRELSSIAQASKRLQELRTQSEAAIAQLGTENTTSAQERQEKSGVYNVHIKYIDEALIQLKAREESQRKAATTLATAKLNRTEAIALRSYEGLEQSKQNIEQSLRTVNHAIGTGKQKMAELDNDSYLKMVSAEIDKLAAAMAQHAAKVAEISATNRSLQSNIANPEPKKANNSFRAQATNFLTGRWGGTTLNEENPEISQKKKQIEVNEQLLAQLSKESLAIEDRHKKMTSEFAAAQRAKTSIQDEITANTEQQHQLIARLRRTNIELTKHLLDQLAQEIKAATDDIESTAKELTTLRAKLGSIRAWEVFSAAMSADEKVEKFNSETGIYITQLREMSDSNSSLEQLKSKIQLLGFKLKNIDQKYQRITTLLRECEANDELQLKFANVQKDRQLIPELTICATDSTERLYQDNVRLMENNKATRSSQQQELHRLSQRQQIYHEYFGDGKDSRGKVQIYLSKRAEEYVHLDRVETGLSWMLQAVRYKSQKKAREDYLDALGKAMQLYVASGSDDHRDKLIEKINNGLTFKARAAIGSDTYAESMHALLTKLKNAVQPAAVPPMNAPNAARKLAGGD